MTDSVYTISGAPDPSAANPVAPTLADSITAARIHAGNAKTSETNAAGSAAAADVSASDAAAAAALAAGDLSAVTDNLSAVAADLVIIQADVATANAGATAAASSAAAAAAAVANAASSFALSTLVGTSTTSLACGTGSKTFATSTSRFFDVGNWIFVFSASDPTVWMHGQSTAYSGGSLTVNVTANNGSATKADWTIEFSSPRGPAGGVSTTGSVTSGRLTKFNDNTGLVLADAGVALSSVGTSLAGVASAPAALALLFAEAATAHGDSAYTILATDKYVYTSAALTASRTWTLPAANAVNPGREIIIADLAGGLTTTNTLVISRAGADTINGAGSALLDVPFSRCGVISDGVSKWSARMIIPFGTSAGQALRLDSNAKIPAVDGSLITNLPTNSVVRSTKTANYTIVVGDKSALIDATSNTFTLTLTAPATIGANFFCYVRNSGTGDVTLSPASGTIDGLASFLLYPSEARLLQCDGSNYFTLLLKAGQRTFTSSGTFVVPPGVGGLRIDGLGAGGGGGSGRRGAAASNRFGGGGAGGGARVSTMLPPLAAGTSVSVTIGAAGSGGAAQTTNSTDGNDGADGGDSSFGAHLVAPGGKKGLKGTNVSSGGGSGASVSTSGPPASSTAVGGAGGLGGGVAGKAAEYGGGSGGTGSLATGTVGGDSIFGGPGGGGGGGIDSGNSASGGAAGGGIATYGIGNGGAGGAGGSPGTAGTTSTTAAGTGGGGGGAGTTGSIGGAGGAPGGGGGGGGGSVDGNNSGAGGAGGRGEIRVFWW